MLISHILFATFFIERFHSFILWEEFVKVVAKLYFMSINYNIIKMSKWKTSNSVLTIDKVINDINTRLVEEDCDLDEVEDDLEDLWQELDEENGNNRDPTEKFVLEDQVI